jgi:hypothetical protein
MIKPPDFRSIRTSHYKFNEYYCNKVTEEFFDLDNDPMENTNLINNSQYEALIENYRVKLDSLRSILQDTLSIVPAKCHLIVNARNCNCFQ